MGSPTSPGQARAPRAPAILPPQPVPVASAPLPRHMALLRAVRDCGTLRVISLVNLGLGDALARSLARALPRLTALRLLDISHNLLSGQGLEALGEVTNHPNPDH